MSREKRVFHTLDGLRGMAAAAVVVFHVHTFFPLVWRPASAYLAVDLFFVLSGFVLAHAYTSRLDAGLGVMQFVSKRLLRLWPLYALGLTIAAAPELFQVFTRRIAPTDLIPYFIQLTYCPWSGRYGELYPLNIPAWSLFYELLSNIFMAIAWRYLTQRNLIVLISVAAIALVVSAVHNGSLDAGYRLVQAPTAIARVAFSFLLGILIWRARRPKWRVNAWWSIAALAVALAIDVPSQIRWAADLTTVFIVFPAIVWIALTAEPKGLSLLVFEAIGAASYAAYTTHTPLMKPISFIVTRTLHVLRPAVPGWIGWIVLSMLLVLAWCLNGADTRLRTFMTSAGRRGRITPAVGSLDEA